MKQFLLIFSIISSTILHSCVYDDEKPPRLDIDVDEISEQISNQIKDGIERSRREAVINFEMNDSAVNDTTGVSMSLNISKPQKEVIPINIPSINVKVEVDNDSYYRYKRNELASRHVMGGIIGVVLVIIISILSVLYFFYKRYRLKSEVIKKSIENNYVLPDAFYGTKMTDFSENRTNSSMDEQQQYAPDGTPLPPPIPEIPRDRKMLNKAIRNISIGIGIFLVFSIWGAVQVGILGIIPILIGGGQLFTYFFPIVKNTIIGQKTPDGQIEDRHS